MRIEGTVCPMPTPTAGDATIDTEALQEYTDFLVDKGVHGLFPCGSIGEFSSLSRAQRAEVVKIVTKRANGVTVLAGCGDTSVSGVNEYIDDAASAGADAAVVVTPYYLSTRQSGLERFFESIADKSPLPIFLYNIPSLTGEDLTLELIKKLADHPKIIGLKDTSHDLTFLYNVIQRTPSSFTTLQGASELAVSSLDIGADGMIAGPANVFPGPVSRLYESYQANNREQSNSLLNTVVHPIVSAMNGLPTAAAIKHLVKLRGHDIGGPVPPLPELTPPERKQLERQYKAVNEAVSELSIQ